MIRNRFSTRAAVIAISWLGACSFTNSFDDVVPQKEGGGAEAGTGGKSNPTGGGSGNEGGTDVDLGIGGMGAVPTAGGGGEGPLLGLPTTGLVVLGGSTIVDGELGDGVLTTLDPETGEVALSEEIPGAAVAGIAYDGRTNLWYIFTSSSFPTDSNSKADLQVRRYDDTNQSWETISKATALPPPQPNGFVVLNDRLAYLSYKIAGGVQNSVTVLDTSDPENIEEVVYLQPELPGLALGIVGSRGAPGDDTVLGGTVAVALASQCTGTVPARTCKSLSLLPIFVGNTVSGSLAVDFGAFGGVPGFASARGEQKAFVALPASTAGTNVQVIAFDPRSPTADDAQLAPTAARWIGGVTFAECEGVTVLSTVDTAKLLALTDAGLASNSDIGHPGQLVGYEPFTQRLIVPYHPASAVFDVDDAGMGGAGPVASVDGFRAVRNGANVAVSALPAADWSGPTDIAVNVVATRYPANFECP